MSNFVFLKFIFITNFILGCDGSNPEILLSQARAAAISPSGLVKAASLFEEFLQQYPNHKLVPIALKESAAVAQQRGNFSDALDIYNRLMSDFPTSEHCDEAQFMVAFIYEEYLQDYPQAREAYKLLMNRYPDSELVVSARHLLPHVGRNPEEWIHFETDDAERGKTAK
jgi:TolA-binding protein